MISVNTISPSLFTFPSPSGSFAASVFPDGFYVAKVGFFPPSVAARPAKPGDIVQLYANGLGPTSPNPPADSPFSGSFPLRSPLTVRIGPLDASVLYAGLISTGLYQVNIMVPNLPAGDHEVVLTTQGLSSISNVLLTVQ